MSMEETFGLTFVEAALAGIKSMGFDSTAIPGIIEKTHGYIIRSCTVNEAVTEIKQLIGKREACWLSEKEIRDISEYFSIERMANEYLSVFYDAKNEIKGREDNCEGKH